MQSDIRRRIQDVYNDVTKEKINETIISEQNTDLPTWFSYQELSAKFIDEAIRQEGNTNNRINEYVSTLKLRMNSFPNDKRMATPLMLKYDTNENQEIFTEFISFIISDFNKYFSDDKKIVI